MDALQTLVSQFVGAVGSKKTMKEATRAILEKMVSYEEHILTEAQQAQARANIGIEDWSKYFGKTGKLELEKGTHDVYFESPFDEEDEYVIFATGHTSNMTVNIIVLNDSELDHFTIKVPVDCTVRWMARIIIEF